MRPAPYHDVERNRRVDPASEGCPWDEWATKGEGAPCAVHPDGFPVFVAADRLEGSDEYAEADPYSVQENMEGAFHGRRIALTTELAREAAAGKDSGGPFRVLDLGCGEGHITEKVRTGLGREAEVCGFDYSLNAIRTAHRLYPEIAFAVADAYACPYSPGFFDLVICNNLWEHVPDPLHLLDRMARVLKPGGRAIISTPSRYRIVNLARVLRGRPVGFMSRHHVTEYTVGQVKEQLAWGGFEVEHVTTRPTTAGSLHADLAKRVIGWWVRLVGSGHKLEETVFYLARQAGSRIESE